MHKKCTQNKRDGSNNVVALLYFFLLFNLEGSLRFITLFPMALNLIDVALQFGKENRQKENNFF